MSYRRRLFTQASAADSTAASEGVAFRRSDEVESLKGIVKILFHPQFWVPLRLFPPYIFL